MSIKLPYHCIALGLLCFTSMCIAAPPPPTTYIYPAISGGNTASTSCSYPTINYANPVTTTDIYDTFYSAYIGGSISACNVSILQSALIPCVTQLTIQDGCCTLTCQQGLTLLPQTCANELVGYVCGANITLFGIFSNMYKRCLLGWPVQCSQGKISFAAPSPPPPIRVYEYPAISVPSQPDFCTYPNITYANTSESNPAFFNFFTIVEQGEAPSCPSGVLPALMATCELEMSLQDGCCNQYCAAAIAQLGVPCAQEAFQYWCTEADTYFNLWANTVKRCVIGRSPTCIDGAANLTLSNGSNTPSWQLPMWISTLVVALVLIFAA